MILQTVMFYLFAVTAVASGVMVVSARNPSLVLFRSYLFNSPGFSCWGLCFPGDDLVGPHAGVVAVLFRRDDARHRFRRAARRLCATLADRRADGFILFFELMLVLGSWVIAPGLTGLQTAPPCRRRRGDQHPRARRPALYPLL
jgi:NADH-quinone oxidoreductase subunit J